MNVSNARCTAGRCSHTFELGLISCLMLVYWKMLLSTQVVMTEVMLQLTWVLCSMTLHIIQPQWLTTMAPLPAPWLVLCAIMVVDSNQIQLPWKDSVEVMHYGLEVPFVVVCFEICEVYIHVFILLISYYWTAYQLWCQTCLWLMQNRIIQCTTSTCINMCKLLTPGCRLSVKHGHTELAMLHFTLILRFHIYQSLDWD